MARVQTVHTNFTAGELSPRLYGRKDLARYDNGAATVLNAIIQPHGGLTKRPGTRYVAATKSASGNTRLAPFRFNQEQAYILEFGANYIRFYRNEAQIVGPDMDAAAVTNGDFTSNITGWTDNSAGTGAISHDATNGRLNLDGGVGQANRARATQQITSANADTELPLVRFEMIGDVGDVLRFGYQSLGSLLGKRNVGVGYHCLKLEDSSGPPADDFYIEFFTEFTAAKTIQVDNVSVVNGSAVELGSPYAAADVFEMKFAQSADTLYIAHPDYPPYKLLRYADDEWSLERVNFHDGPYLDENTSTVTMAPAATTGTGINVTASADIFETEDVGRLIRIKHSSTWGWGRITSVTSGTVVVVDVLSDFGATGAVTAWRMGAWGDIAASPSTASPAVATQVQAVGWPACVTFHEQRLCWAGEKNAPQLFRASKSADFENMAPTETDGTVNDDSALNYRIGADQANAILWMASQRSLVLGTQGGTWPVRASSLDEPLTPTNIQFKRANTYGSANVQPVTVGDVTLYLSPTGRKLRELAYLFERDNFAAPDLSILSEHITEGGVVQMDYAQEPHGLVAMCRADGTLLALTYDREQEVIGWQRHHAGGAYQGGIAQWDSVAAIPAPDGTHDQIWGVVKRTVNGTDVRFVEFMEGPFDLNATEALADAYFLDAGLSYDDPKAITGATAANPVVITANDHGFANGDLVDIVDVVGMTELNGNRYTVANQTTNTFELSGTDGSAFTAYASGGKARKAVTTVSGADHLDGQAVDVVADGVHIGQKTPSSGSFTLTTAASRVHAGLKYNTDIVTMPLSANAPDGSGEGKTKRIGNLITRVHRTHGLKAGGSFDNMDAVPFDYGTDANGDTAPQSGVIEIPFPSGFDIEGQVYMRQDAPLPMTLLAASERVDIAGR